MANSFLSFFLLFSALLSLLYAIGEIFSFSRGNRRIVLFGIFLSLSYFLFHAYLVSSRNILLFPYLFLTHLPCSAILGALLERYLLLAWGNPAEKPERFLLKILPALGIAIWLTPFYFQNRESKIHLLEKIAVSGTDWHVKIPVLFTMCIFLYFLLSVLVRLFRTVRFSVVKRDINLATIVFLSSFAILSTFIGSYSVLSGGKDPLGMIGAWLGIFLLFIYVYRQRYPEFFLAVRKVVEEEKRVRASQLGKFDLTDIKSKLKDLFENDRIYREEELTLSTLAGRLGLSSHQLSEYLNNEEKKSFFQLLNEYRVGEAKEKIRSSPKDTLLTIAYSSGFRSKSTFNDVFRRETGLTPSEYRKRILKRKEK
ncbi:DNA-binding helix-turn-helix protein [Leptospira inadai serovar Lyme str. 10]|uniref:DNA-binding helix-turn-helix protein n=2 Tax=Leptospira inadai serovar Lyme TaxID=293084 RepID=V6HWD0_9LEPT|nr:helix-turn-helix domain-containing protein [Leptospira inadai]EQA37244.1 DNA-binding helix-turn-helix protein [Leptospira inadai serovar Lyme str. 10]PNV73322.1 AraC family transcriptional regulator [Leptospira inadai serovar Lyme]